jgi:hypothetical protein
VLLPTPAHSASVQVVPLLYSRLSRNRSHKDVRCGRAPHHQPIHTTPSVHASVPAKLCVTSQETEESGGRRFWKGSMKGHEGQRRRPRDTCRCSVREVLGRNLSCSPVSPTCRASTAPSAPSPTNLTHEPHPQTRRSFSHALSRLPAAPLSDPKP